MHGHAEPGGMAGRGLQAAAASDVVQLVLPQHRPN